jgi:hypothetical protein
MQSVVRELRRLDRVRTTVRSKGQVLSVYTLCAAVCVCQSIYRMCSIALPELDPPQCMCCCRIELAGAMFGGRLGLTCAVRVPCVWERVGQGWHVMKRQVNGVTYSHLPQMPREPVFFRTHKP